MGERCRQRERSGVSLNVDSGRSLRKRVPRSSHAYWVAGKDRPSSVDVITSQNTDRLQWLVPVRHWRMAQSPFTYYRGAAKLMALDLAETLTTGIHAQICGDAHLSNFGVYGSPDRALVFDINDFDETLPGPWEWDIKRLAASFAIAARQNEFDDAEETDLAVASAAAYRKAMRRFAEMRYLDAWYARIETKDLVDAFRDDLTKKERKSSKRFIEKAKSRDSLHALGKLAESVDGGNRIISQPPLIIPIRDLEEMAELTDLNSAIRDAFAAYLDSVPDHLEVLLHRFEFMDLAVKAVGVGSVGTRCHIVLLQGKDSNDPLFLQIKEATRSVLEDHLPNSSYATAGRRVVEGQRLMQATSDSFLGWTKSDQSGHQYYWRQLKDMKGSADVEDTTPGRLHRYAKLCGWTLARAHARSADTRLIADYLGKSETFDRAIGEFAVAYADQNQQDYLSFKTAIETGQIPAHE